MPIATSPFVHMWTHTELTDVLYDTCLPDLLSVATLMRVAMTCRTLLASTNEDQSLWRLVADRCLGWQCHPNLKTQPHVVASLRHTLRCKECGGATRTRVRVATTRGLLLLCTRCSSSGYRQLVNRFAIRVLISRAKRRPRNVARFIGQLTVAKRTACRAHMHWLHEVVHRLSALGDDDGRAHHDTPMRPSRLAASQP